MIFTHLPFVSELVAQQFREAILTIGGKVAEDRVLVLSPKAQDEKIGSIIIPGNKENMPREGVAILAGELSEENKTYRDLIKVGQVITYGLYAGKEIVFDPAIFPEGLQSLLDRHDFTVLSITEIVFSKNNPM